MPTGWRPVWLIGVVVCVVAVALRSSTISSCQSTATSCNCKVRLIMTSRKYVEESDLYLYLLSRACYWVMLALSAALLIFSFQFSLLFFNVSVAMPYQQCGILMVLIHNIGHQKIWVGTFLVRNIQPSEKTELILTVTRQTAVYLGTHCKTGSKRAYPTGVDRWHNRLLIYWRNVTQHTMPTSVCSILLHDSTKRRRQRSPKFLFSCSYSAQTLRTSPKKKKKRKHG